MKLKLCALFAIFCIAASAKGQTANKNDTPFASGSKMVKELVNIVKRNSIYADSINWKNVNAEMAALASGVKSVDDEYILADYLVSQLRSVGDNHSFFQSARRTQTYVSKNSVPEQPEGKLLNGSIGYVSVPAFTSTNGPAMADFAETVQHIIKGLDSTSNIRGWIVDLRKNGGGNMYPMIAGLGAIINNGVLGYFVPPNTSIRDNMAWFYRDGSVGAGANKLLSLKTPYSIKKPETKVAVLVGSSTASSGEMTALSFIGRKNTKLFGQPTAGYVTANRGFPLSSGSTMVVAVSYTADRNKKKYLSNIIPEIIVEEDEQSGDKTLEEAIKWVAQ